VQQIQKKKTGRSPTKVQSPHLRHSRRSGAKKVPKSRAGVEGGKLRVELRHASPEKGEKKEKGGGAKSGHPPFNRKADKPLERKLGPGGVNRGGWSAEKGQKVEGTQNKKKEKKVPLRNDKSANRY